MSIIKNNFIYAIMLVLLAVFAYMDYRYLDLEFLAYTNGDEFMQYHSLLRMYEGILNINIEDLFRFDSYVYGFVWHLLNLLVVAPFHAIGDTQMAIFMPRLLSAVFSVLCLFMVFIIARLYLNYFYSYGIVFVVIFMSGFYIEGYIFKPNVFQALLILVSCYFLIKDNFVFNKNFYFGILFFGLSVGAAKIQAIMFLPLIYLYIGMVFLRKPNIPNFKFILKYGILSTLAIIFIFIITNPYILHPRGFGAWWWLFMHNMQSNATNHGRYVDVSLVDKIFDEIDFYYFEIVVFVIIISFCLFFLYRFNKYKNLDVFVPIICSMLISFLYLFFFVNKAWSGYYISSIYLCILAFIPFFVIFNSKKLLALILLLQMGGGSTK